MGCIARLGCLILLAILAVCAWFTRDHWMGYFTHATPHAATAEHVQWQPLTLMGATRARAALDTLSRLNGPVFQNVEPGDASAYVFQALLGTLPADADSAEAAVVGDRLLVRASVPIRDLRGSGALGPLASMLGERERLQLGGTFHVIRAGLTEFQVKEVKLHDLSLPAQFIPRLLGAILKGARPDGVSPDGIPIETPKYLADVRVANGRLTLYKGLP
ncbi:MAG TPA: hypothetical protein VG818_12720 [Gemmatimonadaceae bacterium]|nr:hypothetical protein [Gemmatimonadaceae bacterium]